MAAHSVPAKAAVLKEINEANTPDRAMRIVLASNGSVIVDYLLFADAVSADTLRSVIGRVLTVADELGPMITAVHGGSTPIVSEPFPSERRLAVAKAAYTSKFPRSTSPSTSSC